uniref:Uncharacterized protein n=1 Tax=Oryza meridionalis TaxID=40149 RepID=A0A0E0DGW4_9ORYZ
MRIRRCGRAEDDAAEGVRRGAATTRAQIGYNPPLSLDSRCVRFSNRPRGAFPVRKPLCRYTRSVRRRVSLWRRAWRGQGAVTSRPFRTPIPKLTGVPSFLRSYRAFRCIIFLDAGEAFEQRKSFRLSDGMMEP